MKLVDKNIVLDELKQMKSATFGNLVKAVVDIEKKIMVVDAELHVDEEEFLLDQESEQKDLWGINLYPDEYGKDGWIEFDSMINIRPWQNNPSRGVEDPRVREIIINIVNQLVTTAAK